MSQPIVSITINHGADHIISALGASMKQVDQARVSSAVKVRQWLNTQLVREIARAADISPRGIKGRFKQSFTRTGREIMASIWIGVNPLEAHKIGRPSQNNTGVRVRGHVFDGAFKARIYTATEKVFIRMTSKHYDSEKYPSEQKRPGDRFSPRYKKDHSPLRNSGRFPVVKIRIPIAEQMEEILPEYEGPAARKFEEIFEHELKFAMGWFK